MKKKNKKLLFSVLVLTAILVGFLNIYYVIYGFTTGKEVTTPSGIVVNGKNGQDGRGIVREYRDENGDRIVIYSDGTTANIGHLPPISPTNEQIAAAINDYCLARNNCSGDDGKDVTTEEVVNAVETYCEKHNDCAGENGTDGAGATQAQIVAAVVNYCKDGACTGETGATGATGAAGANGIDGRTPQIGCVVKPVAGQPTQFIAWKYSDESDLGWRNLQQITNGQNCKVLAQALTPATPTN